MKELFDVIESHWPQILGGLALALVGYYLTGRNQRRNRLAAAAEVFRTSVRAATIEIPAIGEYWEKETIANVPAISRQIDRAAAEFSTFLGFYRRRGFNKERQRFKQHCEHEIPKALSQAERLYGGGRAAAQSSKQVFHTHVTKLLSYAKYT